MRKTLEDKHFPIDLLDSLHTSGAGFDILRYLGLPELFGTESDTLLYFMGRKIARKFHFHELHDVYLVFEKLGWGKLELIKERRKTLIFSLMSDAVVHRLQAPVPVDFRLEAGFLAEAVQSIYEVGTEAREKINERIHQIEFTVAYTE